MPLSAALSGRERRLGFFAQAAGHALGLRPHGTPPTLLFFFFDRKLVELQGNNGCYVQHSSHQWVVNDVLVASNQLGYLQLGEKAGFCPEFVITIDRTYPRPARHRPA